MPLKEAFISLPSEAEVRAGMDLDSKHPYDFGVIMGMSRLSRAHDTIGPAFRELFAQIMFAPGALDRWEREMVAAVAAAAQDCHYWTQSHAEFLRVEGAPANLVDAIKERRWRALPDLSARTRALCTVAEKISATPTRMVEEDWQPLRDLGFDDRAILEVTHIVGIFNYLTRLADGLGLLVDPLVVEAGETGVALKRAW
jgi:uncharacterized peroxidase-related enzyme